MITIYKFRLKDKHAGQLNKMAGLVNFVWNYCNQTSHEYLTKKNKWLSAYDLSYLTASASKELGLKAATIQAICQQYASSRFLAKKQRLAWRSKKKSLGWVPFKVQVGVRLDGNTFRYSKDLIFCFIKTRETTGVLKGGSFNQDARGRWYLNLCYEVASTPRRFRCKEVGIDLGLKTTATTSDGQKLEGSKHYRSLELKLATAQRARHKRKVKAIHAKIANRRKDELHKFTTNLVKQYDTIFVGDVSSLRLIKTNMAKSVLDASWGQLRFMLEYKAIRLGVNVIEVKENFSTVTCSECFERTGPSGLSALGVREWTCCCGAHHDRDVNAAKNILRFGHESLKGAAAGDANESTR